MHQTFMLGNQICHYPSIDCMSIYARAGVHYTLPIAVKKFYHKTILIINRFVAPSLYNCTIQFSFMLASLLLGF